MLCRLYRVAVVVVVVGCVLDSIVKHLPFGVRLGHVAPNGADDLGVIVGPVAAGRGVSALIDAEVGVSDELAHYPLLFAEVAGAAEHS